MTTESVLDRIKKLWEMAARGTENEAAIASERIAALMIKHQLEQADVDAHVGHATKPVVENGRIDDEEASPPGKRLQIWESRLAATVAEAFGGRGFVEKDDKRQFRVKMIGPKDSVSSARYLFMALDREIWRLGRQATNARDESNAWRRAYCDGMVKRVTDRLRDARQTAIGASTALVRVDQAVKEAYEALRTVARSARNLSRADARTTGYADGGDLDLSDTDRDRLEAGKARLTEGRS